MNDPLQEIETRNARLIADRLAGMTIPQVAEKYGISEGRVSQIWRRSGEAWRERNGDAKE